MDHHSSEHYYMVEHLLSRPRAHIDRTSSCKNTLSFRDINVCPLTLQTKQKITIKVCPSIDGSVVTEYMVR